jgi:hypothetical protein
MARTYGDIDFVVFSIHRVRDVEQEAMALHYLTDVLGALARIGAACKHGEKGEVAMLGALPVAWYRGIPRWRWAAAAFLCNDLTEFSDVAAMSRVARSVHTNPDLKVRCLAQDHFYDCWHGLCCLPRPSNLVFPPPTDSTSDPARQVVGA